jgi:ribosomal protein S8
MKEISYPIPKKLSYPITTAEKKKKSKYGNKKVIIDRIKFDSQKESNRYLYLNLLQKEGLISDLRLQVKYELQPKFKINGKTIRAINYVADFVYKENGNEVIEDVKASESFQTDIYKLKKKLFMHKYGIEIKEV